MTLCQGSAGNLEDFDQKWNILIWQVKGTLRANLTCKAVLNLKLNHISGKKV
jgi:hypothetical protein